MPIEEYNPLDYANLPIDVTAIDLKDESLGDSNGSRTPIWLWRESGKKYLAFVDVGHVVFKSFPVDPGVLLSVEVTNLLRVRQASKLGLAEITSQLMESRLPDLRVEQACLAGLTRDLLDYLRQRMIDARSEAWQASDRGVAHSEWVATWSELLVALEEAADALDAVTTAPEYV